MVKQIDWGDGSGDKITLTYSATSGNQTVLVSSDANTGAARSKVVTFTSGIGGISRQLTINQDAGVRQYVMNGLVLWLDGIDKGPDNTAWVDKVSGYSFTNHGATFNTDNVSFDGDDYLNESTFVAPHVTVGTIEVCFNDEGTSSRMFFLPKTQGSLSCGIYVTGGTNKLIWSCNNSRPMYVPVPQKGTVSVSTARAIANGSAMTASGNDYWGPSSENRIGRASNTYYYKGKIYSIRIYNRKLTEAEVLNNLAVDNERFNLGLTL